jgi:hypothetical protein
MEEEYSIAVVPLSWSGDDDGACSRGDIMAFQFLEVILEE